MATSDEMQRGILGFAIEIKKFSSRVMATTGFLAENTGSVVAERVRSNIGPTFQGTCESHELIGERNLVVPSNSLSGPNLRSIAPLTVFHMQA